MIHVITGEYPPDEGGVADYTGQVSVALAGAGEDVHVWCPGAIAAASQENGVSVHRSLGAFQAADLARAGALIDAYPSPRRMLLQWVPHAFGRRSLNLTFCRWIARRAAAGDRLEIMVHEPFLPFTASIKGAAAAAVHRVMTATLLRAAAKVWVATPAWTAMWEPYTLGRAVPFAVLPEPASVPVDASAPNKAIEIRDRLRAGNDSIVGSFSTASEYASAVLAAVVPAVLSSSPGSQWLAIGKGGVVLRDRLAAEASGIAGRVHATGQLDAREISAHLAACDVVAQPYLDGVCTRHSSAMTLLAHGVPMVTTTGRFTEALWHDARMVSLVPVSDTRGMTAAVQRLLASRAEREELRRRALDTYEACFDVRHTVAALRSAGEGRA